MLLGELDKADVELQAASELSSAPSQHNNSNNEINGKRIDIESQHILLGL